MKLKNALSGESLKELVPAPDPSEKRRFRDGPTGPTRTHFKIAVPPHSYVMFTN